MGTQFHPEKSGLPGLNVLRRFVQGVDANDAGANRASLGHSISPNENKLGQDFGTGGNDPLRESPLCGNGLAKRVIACLDVRALDDGRLAVTKGDQYDVRENGKVRDLGHPSVLAQKYFSEGADEIVFLSIKSYSLKDNSMMLELIKETAKHIFVPLCVGGGIRDVVEKDSVKSLTIRAVDVAAAYFQAGTSSSI